MIRKRQKKTYLNKFYNTEHFYKYYRKNKLFTNEGEKVTKELYKNILFDYNKIMLDLVINRGLNIKLLYGLGTWLVVKFKQSFKNPKMDYGYYNKTGKWVPHVNIHSDNYAAKWFWEKKKIKIKNNYYYSFTPCNTACKMIAKNMQEFKGHNRYSRR